MIEPIPFAGCIEIEDEMTLREEALAVANQLDISAKRAEDHGTIAARFIKAANLLRQQAGRIADLETALAFTKRKPLSDEEIENIAGSCCHGATAWHNPELDIHEFARAIEERHGIK